ncbi:ras-associating and dilute domain-containing protein, partial [Bombina bombina]|uniref:ras-associating and dilute domain-containing protein n=1 Tax=Bombina bombina TaxID=8345 RepID=UPI00235A5EF1
INAQARRLQRNRAKDARCQVTSTPPPLRRTLSETSLTLPSAQEEDARRPYATIPERRADASVLPEERAAIIRHSLYYSAHLLLLQGYSHEQDSLVYLLNREQHTFGFRTPSSKPSIILSAPDILPLHCTIRKVKPPRCAAFRSEKKLVVEPIPGASVSVNFSKVDRTTILQHGDLLGFGAYYLLLYKDPAKAQPLPDQALARLRSLSSQPDLICRMCGRHLREKTSSSKKKESASCSRGGNLITRKHLNLEYERQLEDSLVNKILTLIEPGGDDHKLTPSFLLCLCIQHSASCFTPGDFGQLLLKVTRRIQRMVWERTKDLAEKQSDQQDPTSLSITDLIPDLKHILFWMSNSTELLYFIQQSSPRYLQSMEDELDIKGSKESVFSNTITASEEAMTVLEEVIMYTFQQCVYYISKCLYMMLPALLEGGIAPRDLQSFSPLLPEDVQQVIGIYQTTLDLLQQFEVHQDMGAQMFSYLFFFSNTLLFNQLMERGTSPGFFSCTRGVKIRANLKLLLSWCQDFGYGATAKQFFSKLLSVTELLATPSSQLTQMSWGYIRAEFPSLSHSQLLYVLNHSLNTSEPCTIPLWMPGHEESPVACENIMETFDNHPPIILPSEGFKVKLEGNSMHENIYRHLLYIRHFLWGLRRSPSEPGELQNEISTNPSVRSTAQGHKWDSGTAAHAADNRQNGKHSDSEADGRDISLLNGSPSEERLKEKLRHLHLQSMVTKDTAFRAGMQPLDSSCLLTPPNTPLMPEPDCNISLQLNGISRSPVDIRREELLASRTEENSDCLTPSTCSEEDFCHVFVVEMEKGTMGLGMGLIDGLQTPLNSPGIYIRTLIPDSPAASDGRLAIGDRILAVNGSSLIGATYRSVQENMAEMAALAEAHFPLRVLLIDGGMYCVVTQIHLMGISRKPDTG